MSRRPILAPATSSNTMNGLSIFVGILLALTAIAALIVGVIALTRANDVSERSFVEPVADPIIGTYYKDRRLPASNGQYLAQVYPSGDDGKLFLLEWTQVQGPVVEAGTYPTFNATGCSSWMAMVRKTTENLYLVNGFVTCGLGGNINARPDNPLEAVTVVGSCALYQTNTVLKCIWDRYDYFRYNFSAGVDDPNVPGTAPRPFQDVPTQSFAGPYPEYYAKIRNP